MEVTLHEDRIVGWLCVLFFGSCVAFFAVQLVPGASYLRIRSEGFRRCSLFRKGPLILWRDVSDFRVASVPPTGHRIVVFDWHAAPNRSSRQIDRHLLGGTDALPDNYGLRPEELAELMNEWRSRVFYRFPV
jgi:hypothetical protein